MADERLVKKGGGEPRDGLVQQGLYSIALARRHAAELTPHGWTPADTSALATEVERISTERAGQIDARSQARGKTRDEAGARTQAKAFIRRLRRVVAQALRKQPIPGVTLRDFDAGGRLGEATPKILGYLRSKTDLVRRADPALAHYFGGRKASDELATVQANLAAADSTQEVASASLPADTQEIYEAKGKVVEHIEELNACGRNAFEGAAETAAMFNKDILLRARKERKKKADAPSAGGEVSGGAPPPSGGPPPG